MNMTERNNDKISIHALLAESDLGDRGVLQHNQYFYPRSPCGERRNIGVTTSQQMIDFYPRSPCGERRRHQGVLHQRAADFYPRSPCGERRHSTSAVATGQIISIHALLAESDVPRRGTGACHRDFYPRSPCGERRLMPGIVSPCAAFLSTLSLRRATT